MSNRRPLPALSLVMPHPPLPTVTRIYSPRTPRACTPSTPHLFPKQLIASPRTSIDSWGSSSGGPEDDLCEWKPEQVSLLVRTLDALPGHLYTPFNGPVPPSNLLDKIARSVSQAQGPLEWPHSTRATRAKLIEIARTQDKENMSMTIDEDEEEEQLVSGPQLLQQQQQQQQQSKRGATRKRPLYRQSSMDFLPSKDKASGSLSRLSSRLQRTDRIIPSYHPYARPASRSPSPPACITHHDITSTSYLASQSYQPQSRHFPTLRPRPRSRTSLSLTAPTLAPVLRRTESMASNHFEVENVGVGRTQLRRAGSFSIPVQNATTLKRAPSFGSIKSVSKDKGMGKTGKNNVGVVVEIKPVDSESNTPTVTSTATPPVEKIPQDLETDDEEKARQVKAKRPRTRSRSGTATTGGAPEKKKRGDKCMEGDSKSINMSPGKPVTRSSASSKPTTNSASMCSPTSSSTRSQSRSKSSSPNPNSTYSSSATTTSSASPKSKSTSSPKSKSSSSATKPTASSTAKQTSKLNSRTRSNTTTTSMNCLFGAELPHLSHNASSYATTSTSQPFALSAPFATDSLSSHFATASAALAPTSTSPPKTLRRVRTTAFSACSLAMEIGGMARRISFGSLVDPEAGCDGNVSGRESGGREGHGKDAGNSEGGGAGGGLLGAFEIV